MRSSLRPTTVMPTIREVLVLAVALSAGASSGAAQRRPPAADTAALLEHARRLHREVPMIDTHNDLPEMIHGGAAGDLEKMDPDKTLSIDTDIPRLKKGMVGGQFFAAYVPSSFIEKGGARFALEEIDIIDRFTKRSPSLEAARTADDIVRIHAKGKIASLIGIEGGQAIENSLGALRVFYDLGARYLTLTHSGTTQWADAATD